MKLLPVLCCTLLALSAQAQTVQRQAQVYRCGPEGRDLRDSPCPEGGAARSIGFDEPSAADSRAARERHLGEARQAAALATARRASEAQARQQRGQAVGLQSLPPPAQAASGPQVVTLKPPKLARPHKPRGAASAGR